MLKFLENPPTSFNNWSLLVLNPQKLFTMKKVLQTALFSLLLAPISFGQFYDQDAQYHVDHSGLSYTPNGYAESKILSDTLLLGVMANRLEWSGQYITSTGPGQIDTTDFEIYDTTITYFSNDSVYIYRDNAFHLSFMTAGEVNDVWDLGAYADYANDPAIKDNHAYLKITGKITTVINGELLNVFDVEPCLANGELIDFSASGNFDSLLFVTHSGKINQRYEPEAGCRNLRWAYSDDQAHYAASNILCYNSTNLGFIDFDPEKDCQFDIQKAGIEDYDAFAEVNVFPNPSNGRFTLSLNEGIQQVEIIIVDAIGRQVYSNADFKNGNKIDLTANPSGLYHVMMKINNNQTVHQNIILE